MIKAIIFDRDWIIVDSEALHILSVDKAFKELWINIDEETKHYIVAKHTDRYKDYLLDKYEFNYENFRVRQREIYYDEIGSIKLFEDIINLINDIKKSNKHMLALTTSSSRYGTEIILEKTWLEKTFEVVVTKGDYEKWKPDPEPYLLTAQKLWIEPNECIVFEDSDVWVESAKNAWMICVAIPNDYTKNHDVSWADLIIKDRTKINLEYIQNFIQTK